MIIKTTLKTIGLAAVTLIVGCSAGFGSKGMSDSMMLADALDPMTEVILGGVDANKNGVRDDIESYILVKYKDSPEYIPELMAVSKTIRDYIIVEPNSDDYYKSYLVDVVNHTACLNKISNGLGSDVHSSKFLIDLFERHADNNTRKEKIDKAAEKAKSIDGEAVLNIMSEKGMAMGHNCRS